MFIRLVRRSGNWIGDFQSSVAPQCSRPATTYAFGLLPTDARGFVDQFGQIPVGDSDC